MYTEAHLLIIINRVLESVRLSPEEIPQSSCHIIINTVIYIIFKSFRVFNLYEK